MNYRPGDIVWVDFPRTEMDGVDDRPALLVMAVSHGDFVACMITSRKSRFDLTMTIGVDDLVEGSLSSVPSHVRPLRLTTVNPAAFRRRAGRVSQAFLDMVRSTLAERFKP